VQRRERPVGVADPELEERETVERFRDDVGDGSQRQDAPQSVNISTFNANQLSAGNPFDIRIGSVRVVDDLAFGTRAAPFHPPLEAPANRTFEVYNSANTVQLAVDANQPIAQDADYSYFVAGDNTTVDTLLTRDDLAAFSGAARVRLCNMDVRSNQAPTYAFKLTINGKVCSGEQGETILQVARRHGVYIPTLCHDDRLKSIGACRTCIGEIAGVKNLQSTCTYPASDGMVVDTENARVKGVRKVV